MAQLKIWECRRWTEEDGSDWMGALLVCAETEKEAIKIFKKFDNESMEEGNGPLEIREIPFKKGVLYNDSCR
jgi:hypothetical protein